MRKKDLFGSLKFGFRKLKLHKEEVGQKRLGHIYRKLQYQSRGEAPGLQCMSSIV
jgi:hypothetical protein